MRTFRWTASAFTFGAVMTVCWLGARHSELAFSLHVSFPRTFAAFVLLFAPLWFAGFANSPNKAADSAALANNSSRLRSWMKIAAGGALGIPYFVLTLGTAGFNWRAALIVVALPVLLAAFLETATRPAHMTWRDTAVLAIVVAAYYLKWLHAAWPSPAIALFPKLFLADIALYCFLIVRKLHGSGYSLVPTVSAVAIGVREWAFYVPIALIVGGSTHFIHFHSALPSPERALGSILVTFLLIALPEELFFRAILQNLLETRLGRIGAVLTASILFGLSHFNHGAGFNWRYVLLASIAGIFYGRAWRARRQIFASVVTHTLVDVVWSLWFR